MIYSNDIEVEKEYRNNPSANQSNLKMLDKGVQSFLAEIKKKEDETKRKEHLIIGRGVDTLLTGAEDDFRKEFFVSKLAKLPSDAELEIIEDVFKTVTEGIDNIVEVKHLDNYERILSYSIEKSGWQPRWKMPTKVEKIIESCSDYFTELVLSVGKTVLSAENVSMIFSIANSLKSNLRTAKYFNRDLIEKDVEVDIYYQLPIYCKLDGIPCKALLDIVVAVKDVDGKVISILPCDLKTMAGYTINFIDSAKKYRYDIQAAFYTDCLLATDAVFPDNFPKIDDSIEVTSFRFIVESKTSPGNPLIYIAHEQFIDTGRNGKVNNTTGFQYMNGYKQLLKEYAYQVENGFKEDKIIAESDGVLNLMWDGITKGYENIGEGVL